MVNRFLLIFALVALKCVQNEAHPSLKGMQGLLITCDNQEKLNFVLQYEGVSGFDFMKVTRLPEDNVHLLVSAEQVPFFKMALYIRRIPFKVFIEDFGKLVNEEAVAQKNARMTAFKDDSSKIYDFSYFPRHKEINDYLVRISQNRDDMALVKVGKSYEGRDVFGVQFKSKKPGRPVIFIDAGIHAREWIAPTTALYIISQLANATNKHLYDNVNWYILPQINPDGYEYTHTNYRLWRKTRSKNSGSKCVGTDANRNFGYKWMAVGASNDPCSDVYAGPTSFSEKETQNVKTAITALKGSIKTYLTLHSYGQYLLHPWGFTSDLPQNEPTLRTVAEKAEKALSAIRGTRYKIGSSTNVLYPAAGGSDDWAMAVGGAPLSYTVELPGSSFVTPASQIIPVGIETFEAIKIFGDYVAQTYT